MIREARIGGGWRGRRAALVAATCALAAGGLAACDRAAPPSLYEKVAVSRRTIIVSVSAAGAIEPVRTVEVKSKASGEIVELSVETGDDVKAGQSLARIDPREQRNTLAQAEANLDVAKAQRVRAQSERSRADTLFASQVITVAEHEQTNLAYVDAKAALVRAETEVESARDQMEDTEVRAPVSGTVISKSVELGTVISSPTRDVGGGTILLAMANLDTVQVRALVDETDVGKVTPGLPATITVDAFPARPFEGAVLKIEPMATVNQNVTTFPVLVRIANRDHLLKPGMNAEVEIHVGRREDVPAIPYHALRTQRDVASAAEVLGLDPEAVQQQLEAARQSRASGESTGAGPAEPAGPAAGAAVAAPAEGSRGSRPRRGTGGARAASATAGGGGQYIVFALRDGAPAPVEIRTGLTDLDYVEVAAGLAETDTVLVLPSASLLDSQREMQERVQRMTGGGGLPGVQQQQTTPPPNNSRPSSQSR